MEHVIVERVLHTAKQQLHEPLTLDDLAHTARFSKYHFARMFRRVTGLSPRRFLYALRLQEAKRLLVTTTRGVAEISNDVGYHSVGTFTSRFAASVGVSPAVFRQCGGDVGTLPEVDEPAPCDGAEATLAGALGVEADTALASPVFIGLFRRPVAEGRPQRRVVLSEPGSWQVASVPEGRWYVLAVSARADAGAGEPAWLTSPEQTMLGVAGPVTIRDGNSPMSVEMRLRPMRPVDPPVLTAMGQPFTSPLPAGSDEPAASLGRVRTEEQVHAGA